MHGVSNPVFWYKVVFIQLGMPYHAKEGLNTYKNIRLVLPMSLVYKETASFKGN